VTSSWFFVRQPTSVSEHLAVWLVPLAKLHTPKQSTKRVSPVNSCGLYA